MSNNDMGESVARALNRVSDTIEANTRQLTKLLAVHDEQLRVLHEEHEAVAEIYRGSVIRAAEAVRRARERTISLETAAARHVNQED